MAESPVDGWQSMRRGIVPGDGPMQSRIGRETSCARQGAAASIASRAPVRRSSKSSWLSLSWRGSGFCCTTVARRDLRAMVQQPTNRVERRLSAILAADVAGYSRLMHNDEETTHARLSMLLTDAVEPSIAQHGGRVVKNTGDGLLAEFRSAVEAGPAANPFQESGHEVPNSEPAGKRIAFSVGR